MEYLIIVISAIFVNNVVLSQFLGICPFLGVSNRVNTSLGMGAAVTFVMTISSIVTYLLQHFVLGSIEYMQTIVFILVIAALVQMVEIILKKVSPSLYQALGIFLPLITTNCAVLGIAILAVQKEYNLGQSVVFSAATAIGFSLALVLFAGLRERLELEKKHLTENYELELPYLQGQLEECRKKLRNHTIQAPFDGVVVQLQSAVSGDKVSQDMPLLVLADTTRYLAVGDYVNRRDAEKAERIYVFINGEEYEAEYIPMDQKVYSALVAKGLTPCSSFELYPEEPLEYGHAASIVVQQESRQQVLVIPSLALQQEGSRKYCYLKGTEGREKVYLETGLSDSLYYEVLGGLQEGDEVYID